MSSSRPTGRAGVARRVLVLAGAGLAAASLSGCSVTDLPSQLQIPDPITKQGEIIHSLWQGTWVAGWTVFGFVFVLIVGTAIWFRRKSEELPSQTRYNIPIEVLYTVTPLIVIAVLTLFTWRDESKIMSLADTPDVTVNVVGYQWNWGFNYVNEDVYTTGTPQQVPTLVLPVGEKVRFVLTSPDVAHSFWVPDFLFKMDVIPGRINQFEVTPTKTGHFAGRCAELCGTYHSQMLFYLDVVSPSDYQTYIANLKANGQTGQLDTGRTSDEAQNQGKTEIGGSVDGYVTNGGGK